MPSKLLRAVCLFFSKPDHYPRRPQPLVAVARVQNKNGLNGAIWSNGLFSLCQGTAQATQSSYYFLPFTITFLQQEAQRWLICTCAAAICRKAHVFVCRCCLQPCRILNLPWQRIGPKNTKDNDCQHKEVHINSCVKIKSVLLLSWVLLLKLHWASACMTKAPNLMWILIELFFLVISFLRSSRDHAS